MAKRGFKSLTIDEKTHRTLYEIGLQQHCNNNGETIRFLIREYKKYNQVED